MMMMPKKIHATATTAADLDIDVQEQSVIIEQRLLKIKNQLFIYRIPPMQSIDGHRAELWNLSKPLLPNACSLEVHRKNEELIIDILAERPKIGMGAVEGATEHYLFARSTIHLNINSHPSSRSRFHRNSNPLEHWISPTIDSSRYFALRITNPSTKQEALLGIGFIERNDATNFRMTCDDYVNSLMREKKAIELHRQFEESLTMDETQDCAEKHQACSKSSLGLKEGEKLHINIMTNNTKKVSENKVSKIKYVKSSAGAIGLKKPPPPPPLAEDFVDASNGAKMLPPDVSYPHDDDDAVDGGVDWGDFEG